jgi:hypothetical protein
MCELRSVFIPSSVEIIGHSCFWRCQALSSLSFERGSSLRQIEKSAFSGCTSLQSLYIGASVADIDPLAFVDSNFSYISVDPHNSRFGFRDDFLVDARGVSLIRSLSCKAQVVRHFRF